MKDEKGNIETEVFLAVGVVFICISAWLTHVLISLSDGDWGFLIAGAIMFPIGIIHGIGLWFGFF